MSTRSPAPGTFRIPQRLEGLGIFLPRKSLNWLEVHGWPSTVGPPESAALQEFWQARKVALVKQTSYWGMYEPCPPSRPWTEVVLGNGGHLGPMSFLSDLRAEYFVVHQEPDPECFSWKLKYVNCPNPEERFRGRLDEMEAWLASPSAKYAVRCDEVAWDRFDLVICMDLPIPDRIVQKCKNTCWAYFSTEPGSPLQKEALRRPREGYRMFLNHGFRRYRCRPRNRGHVLEFPYSFQSLAAWNSLSHLFASGQRERRGILIEKGSWQDPLPSTFLPCTKLQGEIREYLRLMLAHRYAVRTDSRPRWGNWGVEAVLAGNVFLARADALDHRGLALPSLDCPTLPSALSRAEAIESQGGWQDWLAYQRQMAEYLAFRRPLAEMTQHLKLFFGDET